jgi:hypothetical protein
MTCLVLVQSGCNSMPCLKPKHDLLSRERPSGNLPLQLLTRPTQTRSGLLVVVSSKSLNKHRQEMKEVGVKVDIESDLL